MKNDDDFWKYDGNVIKCRELKAIHKLENGDLRSPVIFSFSFDRYSININQKSKREIIVKSENDVNAEDLFMIHQNVENLLMLLEGMFIPIKSISFNGNCDDAFMSLSDRCIKDRLRCYESADYCRYRDHKFLDFELLLSEQIYKKWILLRDELGIMHPVFLYNMAKDTSTIDAKAAFLIEMAEPLVELVKEHTIFFSCLSPGKSGTSLRMCLDSLIVTYGKDIFSRELTNRSAYDTFLDKSIKTRVRIMNIKKNAEKGYYSSKEYVLYDVKFSFLYRRIILELLGVPYEDYVNALQVAVEKWDKWLTCE